MAHYQILYWYDIPLQVRSREGRERANVSLPPRFQDWFARQGWQPHPHQLDLLAAQGDTLLIAPTGGGKTLAGFLPTLAELADGATGGCTRCTCRR